MERVSGTVFFIWAGLSFFEFRGALGRPAGFSVDVAFLGGSTGSVRNCNQIPDSEQHNS